MEKKITNYKYVIVGHSSVGKSAILVRFTDNIFKEDYLTTIGVDFKFRKLKIDTKSYKLQIWDTAGQEKYQTITKTFYKNSHAVVIVYDTTSKSTFQDLEKIWLKEIKKNCDENVIIYLIGNKIDIKNREVGKEEAENFARKHGAFYGETSAKSGEGIEEVFMDVTRRVESVRGKVEDDGVGEERVVMGKSRFEEIREGCC